MELVHKHAYISDVRALLNSDVNLHRPGQHPYYDNFLAVLELCGMTDLFNQIYSFVSFGLLGIQACVFSVFIRI